MLEPNRPTRWTLDRLTEIRAFLDLYAVTAVELKTIRAGRADHDDGYVGVALDADFVLDAEGAVEALFVLYPRPGDDPSVPDFLQWDGADRVGASCGADKMFGLPGFSIRNHRPCGVARRVQEALRGRGDLVRYRRDYLSGIGG